MADSNSRLNPGTSSRSWSAITGEAATVAQYSEIPGIYGITLAEHPQAGSVVISGYTESSTYPPASGKFWVDSTFRSGKVIFHSSASGAGVTVNYNGGGTVLTLAKLQSVINSLISSGVGDNVLFHNYVTNFGSEDDSSGTTNGTNISITRTTTGTQTTRGSGSYVIDANSSVLVDAYVVIAAGALELQDRSTQMEISFDVFAEAGYDAGDAKIVMYDGASEIALDGNFALIPATKQRLRRWFTASSSTSAYSIRIKTTVASAWRLVIDDVYVGPFRSDMSTEWISNGATGLSGITTPPTKATTKVVDTEYMRRAGAELQVKGTYQHTNNAGAAAGTGNYQLIVPASLSLDSSVHYAYTTSPSQGICGNIGVHGSDIYHGQIFTYSATRLWALITNATTGGNWGAGGVEAITAATYRYSYHYFAAISGWK